MLLKQFGIGLKQRYTVEIAVNDPDSLQSNG